MDSERSSREELLQELAELRQRLEVSEAERKRIARELEQTLRRAPAPSKADERVSGKTPQRRKADATPAAGEEQYRSIFNAITDGLFVVDPEGTIVASNRAGRESLGYRQDEILGLSVTKLIYPDDRREFDKFVAVVESGGRYRVEGVQVRKDGSMFDVEVFGTTFLFADRPHLLALVRDVTERKKFEEARAKEARHLRRSLEASDRERQLISYEIHDGLAQQLTGAMMQLQAFASLPSHEAEPAWEVFNTGLDLLGKALGESRRLIGGVRPPILDELGLVTAVEHLVNGYGDDGGPEIEFEAQVAFGRLSESFENGLFRIVQECVTNACKHSKSEKVRVAMVEVNKTLHIEVRDWGVGFDVENAKEGRFGLESIRGRARLLGGHAIIDSKPGEGTRVVVIVPLP